MYATLIYIPFKVKNEVEHFIYIHQEQNSYNKAQDTMMMCIYTNWCFKKILDFNISQYLPIKMYNTMKNHSPKELMTFWQDQVIPSLF